MFDRYEINTPNGVYVVTIGHHGTWDVTHPCGRISNCEDLDEAFADVRVNSRDVE